MWARYLSDFTAARRRIEEALANFWFDHAGLDQAVFWKVHRRLPAADPFDSAVLERLPPLPDVASLKREIVEAFTASYPGDDNIRGSDLGCEPCEVAALYCTSAGSGARPSQCVKIRDDWLVGSVPPLAVPGASAARAPSGDRSG
jgi:hypothetical protein